MQPLPHDIADLVTQFESTERDARALVANIDEERGQWRPAPGAWSIAECLDHLARGNRAYLAAMQKPIEAARRANRLRRRPAIAGPLGGWFARSLEPPVKTKMKAPRTIRPRSAPSLHDALDDFVTSHHDVRELLEANADLDLARIRFPNPFVPLLRFSLASGFHILTAHARRHLWQARRVRDAVVDALAAR